ncbi:MAG: methylenetetrahydrofolate reductase, partial [Mucinivorans sp.]
TVRKRPGTVAIAASIASRYGIDVVPHLICGGFSRSDIEDMLIDLSFLGIDNVLALRGDSQSGERSFTPHSKGHTHACELVSQIMEMNSGHYLDTSLLQARATDFCIGVAGYPEKHIEAPNFTTDIDNLKHKIDLGAQYVVTQMFFDNSHYFSYVEKCRLAGITVPIVAGLKPFSTARQLTLLPQTFGLDLPEGLSAQVLNHINDAAAIRQIGTQWAIDQGLELMAAGVPALHFYTMGNADNIVQVAGALFSK